MLNNLRAKIYNLLRWSEKYTKTDMVYLTKGSFWLVSSQVIASGVTFLLAIAYANLLPRETYGIYKYVLSITSILGIFTLIGMNDAVVQAVARGFEGVLKKAFWVQLKWSLAMFFAALVCSIYYFLHGNQILEVAFLIVGCFSPLMNSANTYSAFLTGKKFFRAISFYNVLSTLISSSAIFVTILITKNPLPLILVYFVANAGITLFFYFRTIQVFKPNQNQDPKTISYGKHLSLSIAFNTVAFFLDGPLIFHFLGSASLAIFALAIAPPEQIKALFKNVSNITMPKFSERTAQEIKQTIFHKVIISMITIALIVAVYIVFAPLIYKVFFPKYLESIFYSQIYAISLIATSLLIPYASLESQIAKKELYIYNISASVIQIGLLIPLVIYFGILGAILAKVISRFINLAVSLILVKKLKNP